MSASTQSKYHQLFSNKRFAQYFESHYIDRLIAEHKALFVRQDRVLWSLKWYRLIRLDAIVTFYADEVEPQLVKWVEKEKARLQYSPDEADTFHQYRAQSSKHTGAVAMLTNVAMLPLEHFMGIDYPPLQAHTWLHQTPNKLISELKQLEQKYIALGGDREGPAMGEPVLRVGKYTWFDSGKPACRQEADLMRHCGNNFGRPGQRLFSLRSKGQANPKHWRPHVTLIFNDFEQGITGEIKGFANEKPDEKYHEALVALIESDWVKGMDDGGYKSECNFKLSDLPVEQAHALLARKPDLLDCTQMFQQFPVDQLPPRFFKEFVRHVLASSQCSPNCSDVGPQRPMLTLFKGDVVELAEHVGDTVLPRYKDIICDGYFDITEVDTSWCDDKCTDFLAEFIQEQPTKYEAFADTLEKLLCLAKEIAIEREEAVPTTPREIASLIESAKDDYSEIEDFYRMVGVQAQEAGAYNELTDHVEKFIKAVAEALGESVEAVSADGNWYGSGEPDSLILQVPARAFFTLFSDMVNRLDDPAQDEEFIDALERLAFDDYLFDDIKERFDEPYYGFSGYCDSTAKDILPDKLDEMLDENYPESDHEKVAA